MIYLLTTVLTSVLILVCFRLFKSLRINILLAIAMNYLVAASFGFSQEWQSFTFSGIISKPWFFMAVIMGILLIVTFNMFALSAQKAGVAITAMAARLSLLIPVTFGLTLFHEPYTLLKLTGIILTIPAFFLALLKKDEKLFNRKFLLLPVAIFVANGMIDVVLKTSQYHYIQGDFILFLATAFTISLLFGLMTLLVKRHKLSGTNFTLSLGGGVILGLLNWFSTFAMLKGMDVFNVSVLIPVVNMSIVGLSAITGYFVFRENLRIINLIGLLLGIFAIFLLGIS
ncbi:MAG: hypothetical protein AB9842_00550 [Bacteroidales bacterium]